MAGDSVLAVFDDASAAVRSALTIHGPGLVQACLRKRRARAGLGRQGSDVALCTGRVYTLLGRVSAGVEELRTAVRLNPSFAQAHFGLGAALHTLDRWEEAVEACVTAERLSPHDGMVSSFQSTRALALAMGGQHDEARRVARLATQSPTTPFWSYAALASILGNMGYADEAAAAPCCRGWVKDALKLAPET